MIARRSFVSGLGVNLLFGLSTTVSAMKSKDPCRHAKSLPNTIGEMNINIATSNIGLGGRFRSYGDAALAIHQEFQATIEGNFLNMPKIEINPFLERLSQHELDCLFRLYSSAALNSGRAPKLLDAILPALDKQQIQRLLQLVGFEPLYTATLRAAPTQAQSVLDALYATDQFPNQGALQGAGYNENPLDYTVKEIYLSYRTAPRGSFSVPAAMYETATFAGTRLLGAFGAGYAVGTAIQKAWEYLSPSTWNSFSNYIGSRIDNFSNAVGSIIGQTSYSSISDTMNYQVGAAQENLWGDFQGSGPISWYTSGGDFGVTASWQYKENSNVCK